MDQHEFLFALSPYWKGVDTTDEGVITAATELSAPMNNFFQDDMLTLLSCSTDIVPRRLNRIRGHLLVIGDRRHPRHERARAAVELGRYVKARQGDTGVTATGISKPQQWFQFAAELNSVVGAWELANERLAERMMRVQLDTSVDLLPTLVLKGTREVTNSTHPDQHAAEAWRLGAHIALRHVQGQFNGWESETFSAAIACLVNWLVLRPQARFTALGKSIATERTASLAWIKPLWKRLIAAAPDTMENPDEYRQYLIDQRKAVFLLFSDGEDGSKHASNALSPNAIGSGRNEIIVIPGIIAASGDRSDAEQLKRYEPLRLPIPLTALPDIGRLKAIRASLTTEFPWATDAIAVVMSDLFARRRHGSVRLGMQPVLLVGTPGTGKTRFGQRLSELLGTPNTVINLAGMSDEKTLKGVTRGWASNRPSRMLEFIQQTRVANPLFIIDEVDKTNPRGSLNGGCAHDALLDLLEPGNAKRYTDVFLMTECDLSHCLYMLTSNSIRALSEPLQSRVRMVLFPAPGPEHSPAIAKGILSDMERAWNVPQGTLTLSPREMLRLIGLAPREMKRALLDHFGRDDDDARYTLH